jgi:hypothetical protein
MHGFQWVRSKPQAQARPSSDSRGRRRARPPEDHSTSKPRAVDAPSVALALPRRVTVGSGSLDGPSISGTSRGRDVVGTTESDLSTLLGRDLATTRDGDLDSREDRQDARFPVREQSWSRDGADPISRVPLVPRTRPGENSISLCSEMATRPESDGARIRPVQEARSLDRDHLIWKGRFQARSLPSQRARRRPDEKASSRSREAAT